jgi:chorismate mutase
VRANDLLPDEIVSAIFTMTPDLDAAFPARAARDIGWTQVPLLDAQQPRVRGDLARCIRVMIHCSTERTPDQLRHVYQREARGLRSDLAGH